MSDTKTAILTEVIRGVFDLLKTWWVVLGLVVMVGMYTEVLTQKNIITVMNKVVQIVK